MRIIGLTGGIASGKSTVARIIAARGIPVIDADQLARDAVLPGMPALAAIVARFGSGILGLDGTLDRQALGAMVFADQTLRRQLEGIIHPAIKVLAENRLERYRSAGVPVVIYMAPVLIEAGAMDRVDELWVVYADRETQLERLMVRDGLGRDEALQRLSAQMCMEEKAKFGRIVINNCGTEAELERVVLELCCKELGGE